MKNKEIFGSDIEIIELWGFIKKISFWQINRTSSCWTHLKMSWKISLACLFNKINSNYMCSWTTFSLKIFIFRRRNFNSLVEFLSCLNQSAIIKNKWRNHEITKWSNNNGPLSIFGDANLFHFWSCEFFWGLVKCAWIFGVDFLSAVSLGGWRLESGFLKLRRKWRHLFKMFGIIM